MKQLLFVSIMIATSFCTNAQNSGADHRQKMKDSIRTEIIKGVGISSAKADSVLAVIYESNDKMIKIARDKALTRQEKDVLMAKLASKRDGRIASFVPDQKIKLLQSVMMRNRERMNQRPGTGN